LLSCTSIDSVLGCHPTHVRSCRISKNLRTKSAFVKRAKSNRRRIGGASYHVLNNARVAHPDGISGNVPFASVASVGFDLLTTTGLARNGQSRRSSTNLKGVGRSEHFALPQTICLWLFNSELRSNFISSEIRSPPSPKSKLFPANPKIYILRYPAILRRKHHIRFASADGSVLTYRFRCSKPITTSNLPSRRLARPVVTKLPPSDSKRRRTVFPGR
jgi:hypothetical protein